jgi:hypothetical protein
MGTGRRTAPDLGRCGADRRIRRPGRASRPAGSTDYDKFDETDPVVCVSLNLAHRQEGSHSGGSKPGDQHAELGWTLDPSKPRLAERSAHGQLLRHQPGKTLISSSGQLMSNSLPSGSVMATP